jgi:hypothetical protein
MKLSKDIWTIILHDFHLHELMMLRIVSKKFNILVNEILKLYFQKDDFYEREEQFYLSNSQFHSYYKILDYYDDFYDSDVIKFDLSNFLIMKENSLQPFEKSLPLCVNDNEHYYEISSDSHDHNKIEVKKASIYFINEYGALGNVIWVKAGDAAKKINEEVKYQELKKIMPPLEISDKISFGFTGENGEGKKWIDCENCGDELHIYENCPTLFCKACKKNGHSSEKCPKFFYCGICSTSDHDTSNCIKEKKQS